MGFIPPAAVPPGTRGFYAMAWPNVNPNRPFRVFRVRREPVCAKKTRQIRNLAICSDSTDTEKALEPILAGSIAKSAALLNSLYGIINLPRCTEKRLPGNGNVQIEATQYRRRRGDRHPHPCRRTLRHAFRRRL